MIARPRVEDRLRVALERGPVAVVAPAGAGKSAALTGALRGWDGPVVWHVCTPRDADAGRLLVGVLRALRRVVPGAADVLLEQLLEPGAAVDPLSVVEALLDELAVLVDPVVLVLDDGEHLSASDALAALLDADVAVLRTVLLSRTRPSLRLARRAAAGTLTLFDEDDLRFDAAECAALLAERDGREPSEDAVVSALATTHGWPLGLALGVGAGDELEQYVVEELLDPLDAAARAAVLDSAIDGSLPPVAREHAWHPLVREALRARWRLERPAAARAALLARVAGELLAAGRAADAVDAWLEAEQPEAAIAAMTEAAPEVLRAAPGTVRAWLDALPETAAARADVAWLEGRLAASEGRMREAAAHYTRALGAAAPAGSAPARVAADSSSPDPTAGSQADLAAGSPPGPAVVLDDDRRDVALFGLMECAYFLGEPALGEPVRDLLGAPEALAGRPLGLLAAAWFGINLAAHGEIEAGVALAERAFAQDGGELAREFEPLLRTFAEVPFGGHAALRATLEALEAGRGGEFPEWMASIRGFVEADAGFRDAAVEHARRMVDRAGTRHWQSLGHVQLAWALAAAGRLNEAETALAPLADRGFEGWPSCWVDIGLALVAHGRGDTTTARDRAERALRSAATGPLFLRGIVACDLAPVLDPPRARALVEETLAAVVGDHARGRLRAERAALGAADEPRGAGDRDATGASSADDADSASGADSAGAASSAGGASGADGADGAADALDDVHAALAAGPDVVRAEWTLLRGPVWDALERGELEAEAVVALVDAAFPGRPELLELAAHPTAAVRAAVGPVVARSGHPAAAGRLKVLREDADPTVVERARRGGAPETPPLNVRLFGGFEVRRGEWPVEAWSRPTAARLVRFLLVQEGVPAPQDLIFEALWPGRDPGSAKSQLQVAVSRARTVIDTPEAAESAIVFADGAYRIALPERDRVDTEAFAQAAAAALAATGSLRRPALEQAAQLWGGPPLPEERYAGWADTWRERLQASYHRVLNALAAEQRAANDEPAVIETARRLTTDDPLDEGAHRLLIEAYARTGRPALALRQYLTCRRALVDGLGVEPSAETRALQEAVLAGRSV
ncbi:hypothetical protein OJ997_20590 [Solirubrobacter phytolaccae]|uniref:Bacterial transcriptional activator domain-containing protein n=1 Tax=Solirubrobacter phytolaccae TaxID=1404360 RepID=A0A9X3ND85_9ACTN|nr:BTAD domain-containing putative transcriptional regulator [Solirubrobacter phytolaccae]MDA0182722.1 hypothetical protein [Solirubrobacter phytolaccae]